VLHPLTFESVDDLPARDVLSQGRQQRIRTQNGLTVVDEVSESLAFDGADEVGGAGDADEPGIRNGDVISQLARHCPTQSPFEGHLVSSGDREPSEESAGRVFEGSVRRIAIEDQD
jgi:hypothetical protein